MNEPNHPPMDVQTALNVLYAQARNLMGTAEAHEELRRAAAVLQNFITTTVERLKEDGVAELNPDQAEKPAEVVEDALKDGDTLPDPDPEPEANTEPI